MHEVDLRFICTAHHVEERSLRQFVILLLDLGGSPCSIDSLAELHSYSTEQTKRFLRALSWQDDHNPPVIKKETRKGRGNKGRRIVNQERAARLGLINYAA